MLPLHSNLWGQKYFVWELSTKKAVMPHKLSYKRLVTLIAWQLSLSLNLPFHLCLSSNVFMKTLKDAQKWGNWCNEPPQTRHIDSAIMICHACLPLFTFSFSFLISFQLLDDIKSNPNFIISTQTYLVCFPFQNGHFWVKHNATITLNNDFLCHPFPLHMQISLT